MNDSERTIRFCINNPRNLGERNDLIARGFISRDCLGNCTRCFETRFLEINTVEIEGESYDEILRSPVDGQSETDKSESS